MVAAQGAGGQPECARVIDGSALAASASVSPVATITLAGHCGRSGVVAVEGAYVRLERARVEDRSAISPLAAIAAHLGRAEPSARST